MILELNHYFKTIRQNFARKNRLRTHFERSEPAGRQAGNFSVKSSDQSPEQYLNDLKINHYFKAI